jgi:tRNA (cytidine/uridine-2'-O-)-methyltransferase
MLNVVLFRPENPHNTGAIARTCAMLTARLHLIKPYGFDSIGKDARRASMGYLEDSQMLEHESWEAFIASLSSNARIWLFSDKGPSVYTQVEFLENDYLVFGRESDGLPLEILNTYPALNIPMPGSILKPRDDHRFHSLNLSVSVGIAAYEAARQIQKNWLS